MASREQFEELARQLSAIGAVKRELGRILPVTCPPASAAVLTLINRNGEMRIGRLAELLSVDMSVTSRHVAHVVEHGWVERIPDPADRRSRILRLTPAGADLLEDLASRYMDALTHHLQDWSDDDVGHLVGLLARLRDAFGDCRAGTGRSTITTRTPA